MNRIKKTGLGLLVATLAFGFSAFTTKKPGVLVYYKTSLTYPSASDPRGYKYYSDDMCSPGGTKVCSAQWNIGTNPPPSDGSDLPAAGITFVTGSTSLGTYDNY